jgi:hypothetical protein
MKAFIALWLASRLGLRARELRRSLRDYHKNEHARIFELEHRCRGLRLYAAWVRNKRTICDHGRKVPLLLPTEGSFRDPAKLIA